MAREETQTVICVGYLRDLQPLIMKDPFPPIGFEQPSKYWRTHPWLDFAQFVLMSNDPFRIPSDGAIP